MATPQAIGDLKTASAPVFYNGTIWFREDQTNRLMALPMDDPSKAVNPAGLIALAEPSLVQGRYIAFCGQGAKLTLVTTDAPYFHGQIGSYQCLAAKVVGCGPYIYYRSYYQDLVRVRIDRDHRDLLTAVNTCANSPAISAPMDRVWYTAIEKDQYGRDQLCYVDLKTMQSVVAETIESTSLYAAPNGLLWATSHATVAYMTQVKHHTGEMLDRLYSVAHADPIRPCTAPYGNDDYIYYVYYGDLYRAKKFDPGGTIDSTRELLAKGCATSPEVQPGFVLYGGADKNIYKLAI